MSKRILVAPLDWGLGHATRCIPIVQALLNHGAEVILAGNGPAYALLKMAFPALPIAQLPAYNILYPTVNMYFNIAVQTPKIIRAIWQEHQAVQKLAQHYRLDAILSDHRYGCFVKGIPNVFIAHQLQVLIPNQIIKKSVNAVLQSFIRQFDACWIPDLPGHASLSGALSEGASMKMPCKYLGVLSDLQPITTCPSGYDVVAVLSGPEPQRTRFEQLIVQQARTLPQQFLIVQGRPGYQPALQLAKNIDVVAFLSGSALNEVVAAAGVVVCRAGYSSIMDLAVLGKKALLVPTPGQTEQLYLAQHLMARDMFYSQPQKSLDLSEGLERAQQCRGLQPETYRYNDRLAAVVGTWLNSW